MHGGVAKNIIFFTDKDPAVLAAIIPFLVPAFIQANDFVYKTREYSEEIYFIVKGKINYLYSDNMKILNSVLKGSYFGDIEIFMRAERIYSTRADRDTELLSMNKALIGAIKKDYPSV